MPDIRSTRKKCYFSEERAGVWWLRKSLEVLLLYSFITDIMDPVQLEQIKARLKRSGQGVYIPSLISVNFSQFKCFHTILRLDL